MKNLLYTFWLCCCFATVIGFSNVEVYAQDAEPKPQIAVKTLETGEKSSKPEIEPLITKIKESADFSTTSNLNAPNLNRVGIQTTQTVPLSLNEAIRKALENNNNIEVARDDVRFQETQLRSLLGAYDPVLSVTPNFSRSSSTGSDGSNDFRVDAGVNKLFERGGGSINTFFNNSQTGNNSRNNTTFNQTSGLGTSSSTTFFSNLGINYTQPLFRNFRVDNTRRQIKIQRKRLQQSDADFRRQTIDIISQVQRTYWDLVFALRNQQNQLANVNLARENLRQVEVRIGVGTAAPLARAEVNTELANREGDLLSATEQVSITENNLKTLLLRDPSATEWTQAFVPTDSPVYSDEPVIVDDAIKDAIDNRPELRRLRLQREVTAIDIDYFKNQTKPRIDLVSSFSLNGLSLGSQNTGTITSPLILDPNNQLFTNVNANAFLLNQLNATRQALNLPLIPNSSIPTVTASTLPNFLNGGTTRSIGNLFRSDAPNYTVGVTFELPFGNRTAKANLAGARIQQQQTDAQTRAQEQTVVADVRNAVQAVETSRQRILTARRARESAEIQLEGERKLFEVGRSTTFLLFQRENALTNARNSEIRAETDYNKSLSDLQRATSTTFQLNNIEVNSPMNDTDNND
ncbi:MAG: TolC family protein [Acidobacteria bacterium]|jgi:HAE1 family hydrophobic/amphiphilic exporter-1|nr:TolC family protein [Acidobacteriota bacterium]